MKRAVLSTRPPGVRTAMVPLTALVAAAGTMAVICVSESTVKLICPLARKRHHARLAEALASDNHVRSHRPARRREAQSLRRYAEDLVALQRAAGRGHCDETRSRFGGNGCRQVGVGVDREGCRRCVEGNSRGASESLPENLCGLPDLP